MSEERKLQSERIAEMMKEKNVSYRILSDKTGIAKSSLQRYVTNVESKIPTENLKALAEAFDVSLYWLLGKNVPKKPNYDFILKYVDNDDKEIVRYALENGLTKDDCDKMDDNEQSIKILLNSFGFDLVLNKDYYYLIGDTGFCQIDESDVETLVNSTVEFLEFNAKKLYKEKNK